MEAVLPLALLAMAFVLMIVLPARARSRMAAQSRQLQESLSIGSRVMTTSGLFGRVTDIQEKTVDLEVAPGVVVTFVRQAIAELREPDTPALNGDKSEGAAEQ